MTKTKWEPGPWHTGGTFNPGTPAAKQNIWGPTPAGKQSGSVIAWDVAIRNSPLIASAPELYAALLDLREEVRCLRLCDTERNELADLGMACDKADAAIAKANGESR